MLRKLLLLAAVGIASEATAVQCHVTRTISERDGVQEIKYTVKSSSRAVVQLSCQTDSDGHVFIQDGYSPIFGNQSALECFRMLAEDYKAQLAGTESPVESPPPTE